MYSGYDPDKRAFSLITAAAIIIIAVASLASNIYLYQLYSNSLRSLENKVATLQTQISGLTEVLKNYTQSSLGNTSLFELYENVKDSVVLIRGKRADSSVAGSGFVYYHSFTFQNVIVTNYHVVRGVTPTSLYVTLMNGQAYSATVLGYDVYADLAILLAEDALQELRPLSIVSSSLLNVGDLVIAIGNPYELIGSMTTGIVSQLGRAVPEELAGGYNIADVIQISAPINPGNSGGPLLNSRGQVVGVTFAIIENSTGVGFAIPSDTVLREISWLINGDIYPHSWIGVMGTDMNYEISREIGTLTTYGWLVVEVISNSPASVAGLKKNDLILALNGTQTINGDAISNYLERHTSPGQTISITIERDSSQTIIPLVLGIRPQPS